MNQHISLENYPRYQLFLSQRRPKQELFAQFHPDPIRSGHTEG